MKCYNLCSMQPPAVSSQVVMDHFMNWVRKLVGKAGTEGEIYSLVVFLIKKYKGMLPLAPSHLDLD